MGGDSAEAVGVALRVDRPSFSFEIPVARFADQVEAIIRQVQLFDAHEAQSVQNLPVQIPESHQSKGGNEDNPPGERQVGAGRKADSCDVERRKDSQMKESRDCADDLAILYHVIDARE